MLCFHCTALGVSEEDGLLAIVLVCIVTAMTLIAGLSKTLVSPEGAQTPRAPALRDVHAPCTRESSCLVVLQI